MHSASSATGPARVPASLVVAHAAATWFMVGLIWFVQVVHYPLLGGVGADMFVPYERAHMRLTTFVVLLPMLVEAGTALALAWAMLPTPSRGLGLAGIMCLAGIWGSTAAFQVPAHEALSEGFDPTTHYGLVSSNWIRTALWTVRGALAALLCARVTPSAAADQPRHVTGLPAYLR